MILQDKSLQCYVCGATFTFSADEQELFSSRGYINDPKRCLPCRQAKKTKHYVNSSHESPRQMFPVVCAECGKDIQIPFKPRGDKVVYCSDCYHTARLSRMCDRVIRSLIFKGTFNDTCNEQC